MAHAEVKRVGKAQKKYILELSRDQAEFIAAAMYSHDGARDSSAYHALDKALNSDMRARYSAFSGNIGGAVHAKKGYGVFSSLNLKVIDVPVQDSPDDVVVLTMAREDAAMVRKLTGELPGGSKGTPAYSALNAAGV